MPTEGPLIDPYGRIHTDLRISVTDRCNLRCTYCMPEEGMTFLPRAEILTLPEIVRIATVAARLGVDSVRLTGGEPLVRREIVEIVGALSTIGFDDVSMTTNGTALARLARPLADAGLRRVNVSCDSLRPETFSGIRRRATLGPVLDAMDAAEDAGLTPVKVNVVLVPGENDGELLEFARLARSTGRIVRFIEFMPLDASGRWRPDLVVPGRRVIEEINAVFPLERVGDPSDPAPASRFRFLDGIGEIGVISSVTEPFCGTCNRLRVMADGAVRNCLFSDDERSLRDVLRTGGGDAELETVFRRAIWGKRPGHGINDPNFLRPVRSMSRIGG
ncbi:MAG TPA: GTP 3',8-cyclase MoaA [Acidimicrobiales bacterium]|jgi:cyclic pyranopterin phosphate synthase|nr:GTP 3',8-cyclase MoaA [Acidimicrobiales bacterium]